MIKDRLYIIDSIFPHAHSSSWYNSPKEFEWVREDNVKHIVLTDNSLNYVNYTIAKKKYAWLIESPEITKHAYEFIKNNHNQFDLVFTFDKELLKISDKFVLLPIGGCWIKEHDRKIYEKNSNTSIILSNKKLTEGHKLRHSIALSERIAKDIDVYGFTNPIPNKVDGLKNHRFSVVIENTKKDYYFTEKIIDCFMTGTIPIYWGCPSIGDFFNINGILTFDTAQDIENILTCTNEDLYNTKLKYIQENFELAKKYTVADDLIYNIIKNG